MNKSSLLRPGSRILVDTIKRAGFNLIGTVTGHSVESGRDVYDYNDQYGNPRWCYGSEIITTM